MKSVHGDICQKTKRKPDTVRNQVQHPAPWIREPPGYERSQFPSEQTVGTKPSFLEQTIWQDPRSQLRTLLDLAENTVIKTMLQNIQCLVSQKQKTKTDFLAECAQEESVDIIALTETWLRDAIDNKEINIPGYSIFICDRVCEINPNFLMVVHSVTLRTILWWKMSTSFQMESVRF